MSDRNRQGSALMLVVIAAIFLIILTGALYTYLKYNTESHIWTRDRMQSRYTAEAGIHLATHMVVAGASLPTASSPEDILGTVSSPEVLPGSLGSAYVTVHSNRNNEDLISSNAYMFNCIGFNPGGSDSTGVRAVVSPLNLARFSVFMDDPTIEGAYTDGYRFDGPFYANGPVRVVSDTPNHEKDPFFYSFQLTSDYYVSDWSGTHATGPAIGNLQMRPFERLSMGAPYFELEVDTIPFGKNEINWQGVRNAAISGGLYFTAEEVPDGTRFRLVQNTLELKTADGSPEQIFDLNALENPVIWFDNNSSDRMYVRGHGDPSFGMDSALTVGMNGDLYLAGNLVYSNQDLEDPENHCLVGFITVDGSFIIAEDPDLSGNPDWVGGWQIDTEGDFQVNAVLLALEGVLEAENYRKPEPGPAQFTVVGGYMIQNEGFTSTNTTGFDISVNFDPRLLSMHPPFFPTTGNWNTTMWEYVPGMTRSAVKIGIEEW
ncbi:hypothetical protein CSA37_06290 [Candidatus Fermentibacteria bacterium]|nr:MAG: hypothetical protein CSA37_06290 [Candidatus Fermentibacteria bacterium]